MIVSIETNLPAMTVSLEHSLKQGVKAVSVNGCRGSVQVEKDPVNIFMSGESDKNYIHRQDTANETWNVVHNMGKFPAVEVVDSSGDSIETSYNFTNENELVITFSAPTSGRAYLN